MISNLRALLSTLLLCIGFVEPVYASGQISVTVKNAAADAALVVQIFDNADDFTGFRKPFREAHIEPGLKGPFLISDVPAGTVAVVVYADVNANGRLDKNFIGIPKELVGLSSKYRPKGPPSFRRASFQLDDAEVTSVTIVLDKVLGESGQWGIGLGAVGQSSPYLAEGKGQLRVFPAITYLGERLQWLGPTLRYGLAGSGKLRLALTASYRFDAYEEADSPQLAGLGDRDDTVMAGLGLRYDGPAGTELELGYEHDALDRIGGGMAELTLSRPFSVASQLRLTPGLGVAWLSRDLADYDFGVPPNAVRPGRPAYRVGDSLNLEAKLVGVVELNDNWLLAFTFGIEFLDNKITASPIVDEDRLINGFAALTYAF